MSAEEYVRRVAAGEFTDRTLSPQLKSGLRVRGVIPDYLNDPNSANYASLLDWENPDWRPATQSASAHAPVGGSTRPKR